MPSTKDLSLRLPSDTYRKLVDLRKQMGAVSLAEVMRRLIWEEWLRRDREKEEITP